MSRNEKVGPPATKPEGTDTITTSNHHEASCSHHSAASRQWRVGASAPVCRATKQDCS